MDPASAFGRGGGLRSGAIPLGNRENPGCEECPTITSGTVTAHHDRLNHPKFTREQRRARRNLARDVASTRKRRRTRGKFVCCVRTAKRVMRFASSRAFAMVQFGRTVKTRTQFPRQFALAMVTACVAVSALTLRARADSLDHGFVEPCTLANVQEPELQCEACASAFGSRACDERLAPRGFVKKCRTRGTHAGWDEIWCARRTDAAKGTTRESSSGTTGLVVGAAATLAAAVVMMRVLGKPSR